MTHVTVSEDLLPLVGNITNKELFNEYRKKENPCGG